MLLKYSEPAIRASDESHRLLCDRQKQNTSARTNISAEKYSILSFYVFLISTNNIPRESTIFRDSS